MNRTSKEILIAGGSACFAALCAGTLAVTLFLGLMAPLV